jgi:membrane fusion protein (multidrug efflux system)
MAMKTLERQQELMKKDVTTAQRLDEATQAVGVGKGSVLTAEGNLSTAQINLGYTEITAPITGKIGRTSLTKGNVVSPESGVLATIVSQDPMYVTFPMSQREFLRAAETGNRTDVKSIKVQIRFSDGALYNQVGAINFVDVTVNQATDTVMARATLPNPDGALIAEELVRVNLETRAPEEAITIPQAALIADQEGVYVFVVEDGKAVVKRVKPGGETGDKVVIESGLSAGDLVIVDGLQGVRPGIAVRASPMPQALRQG